MLSGMELLLFGTAFVLIVVWTITTIGYVAMLIQELFGDFLRKYFPNKYYYDDDEEA